MKVDAAVARRAGGEFAIEQVELEEPRDDEILVRIVGTGLCHTDLICRDQAVPIALPAVFGHEGSGVVERVGSSVRSVAPGDHVVLSFTSCGTCVQCVAGSPAYCESFLSRNFSCARPDGSHPIRIDGAAASSAFFGQSSFAMHCLATERNTVKVSRDAPLAILGPLGCGIQTGVGAVLRSVDCRPHSSMLVIGGGAVGLSAVLGGVLRQCEPLIVAEPHASRRALALELGASHALGPLSLADVPAAVREIIPRGVDYVLDTSGVAAAAAAGIAALAQRGTIGLIAAAPGAVLPLSIGSLMGRGHTIRGIIEGDSDPQLFIPELIDLHRQGRFPFERLIHTYTLAEINEAVADQHNGRCVKAVLLCGSVK